jgi:DNA-binding transcriptional LysR family regulator
MLEFADLYPEVSLDMDYTDRRSNLFEEGLDLTVRIAQRLEPGDVARRIGTGRMMVMAAPAYLARHGEPRHPDELLHHECLVYTAAPSAQSWEFLIDGQPRGFPVRSRLQANNGEVLLQAAIRGLGLVYGPTFICAEALATGAVRQVLADFPIAEPGIYAVLPGNRHVPHRVRVLIDFLAERLAP